MISNEATEIAERIGFPVMIKAAAGGGGRGIRIARQQAEFAATAAAGASVRLWPPSAMAGFISRRSSTKARHIEVQVLGDGERAIHCFERECSLQRRRQKVWEEAPSPVLPDPVRQKLCASAVALAEAVQLSRRRHDRISL